MSQKVQNDGKWPMSMVKNSKKEKKTLEGKADLPRVGRHVRRPEKLVERLATVKL